MQPTDAGSPASAGDTLSWQVLPCATAAVKVVMPPEAGRLTGEALNDVTAGIALAGGVVPPDGVLRTCFRRTDLVTWWLDFTAFTVIVNCRGAADGFAPTWKVRARCPEEQLRVFGNPARCGEMLTRHDVVCLTVTWRCVVPPEWPTELGDNVSAVIFGRLPPAACAGPATRNSAATAASIDIRAAAVIVVSRRQNRRPLTPTKHLIIAVIRIPRYPFSPSADTLTPV